MLESFGSNKVKFYFPPNIYILAGCQVNLNLVAENRVVTKCLGETAVLQWNIKKGNDADTITTAVLYLLGNNQRTTLFILDISSQKPLPVGEITKELFSDRITAEIKDGKVYLVTFTKLNFSDANLLELAVETSRGTLESGTKRVNIKLLVQGMEDIIICCCCL